MHTCSSLLRIILLQVILIFMAVCQERNAFLSHIDKPYCPFIETLSFGSDITIKCNQSYFIFNEINSNILKWKFADQTSNCRQNGAQHAGINQCGIKRISSNYLQVPLRSLGLGEDACAYCQINYKPIVPLITVTQEDYGEYILYIFNITATGLASNESFEILWAKRVNDENVHSYNYWFLRRCVDSGLEIFETTDRTIRFAVDEVSISRVEFIIRRCNGACRTYKKCSEEEFEKQSASNYLTTPDAIEKISCDYDCLNGIITTTISTVISSSLKTSSKITVTNITPSNIEERMKLIIICCIIGLLSTIPLLIFIIYKLCQRKKKKYDYTKANNVNPDEHK